MKRKLAFYFLLYVQRHNCCQPFILSRQVPSIQASCEWWRGADRKERDKSLLSSITLSFLLSSIYLPLRSHWYIHPSFTSLHYLSPLYASLIPSLVPSSHHSLHPPLHHFIMFHLFIMLEEGVGLPFFLFVLPWQGSGAANSSKAMPKNKECKVPQHFYGPTAVALTVFILYFGNSHKLTVKVHKNVCSAANNKGSLGHCVRVTVSYWFWKCSEVKVISQENKWSVTGLCLHWVTVLSRLWGRLQNNAAIESFKRVWWLSAL